MSKRAVSYVPCPAGRSCRYGATRHEEGSPKLDECRRVAALDGGAVGSPVSVAPPRASVSSVPEPRSDREVRTALVEATLGEDPYSVVRVPVDDAVTALESVNDLVEGGHASEATRRARDRLALAVLDEYDGSAVVRVEDAREVALALPVTVTPELVHEAIGLPGGAVAEDPNGVLVATGHAFFRPGSVEAEESRVLLGALALRTLRARAASEVSADRALERTTELVSEAIDARRTPRPPRTAVSGSREGLDLDPATLRRASGSIASSVIVSERYGVEVAPPHVLPERLGYEVLASRDRVRAHVGRADIAALAARRVSGGVADGPTDRREVYETAARTLAAEASGLRALVVPRGGGGPDGYPRDWPDGAPEAELARLDSELALVRGALDDLDRAYESATINVDDTTTELWNALREKDEASTRRRREVAHEVSERRRS